MKPGNTIVTQQNPNDSTLIIKENTTRKGYYGRKFEKYHHTEGSCTLLHDPCLYWDIKALREVSQVEAILDGTYACPDNNYTSVKTFLRHLQRPATVSDKYPPTLMSLANYR